MQYQVWWVLPNLVKPNMVDPNIRIFVVNSMFLLLDPVQE